MAILTITVVKGKSTVELDTDKLPDAVYAAALAEGLKVLVNKGTSKITKAHYPDEAELKSAANAKAAEQVEAILDGTIKLPGAKSAKATGMSREVMTEAMRLARNLIKDSIKKRKEKIGDYEPKDITAAAKELLTVDTSIIEMAKANLEARSKVPVSSEVLSTISASPKRQAANAAKNAKTADQLSAKQAGMVKAKAKPKGMSATAH